MTTTIDVRCLCGEVVIALTGEPAACFYCHCDDCQAVHGAACLPVAMYRAQQTRIVRGDPLFWRRKTTARATCRACGTRLFAEPPDGEIRTITAYLLPPGVFQPTFHVQCRHALLPVRDALPHYEGFPAVFGGSDARVAW
ncbi:MAG TPA: GFA family protein [Polyangiaceae bacterium]|nr:GFA family protein [Polyangiaceae bacterium]